MLVGLSCYGLHRYWMIYLYYRYRRQQPRATGQLRELPAVTVQLPMYNEMYVAERLLDAVAALDYPSDKLEIQVLDDSTDETTQIVARKLAELRELGINVSHIHRSDRTGFKAGALENGLRTARGEFIAIFDADFLPPKSLLKDLIHHFADPRIGMVQTRWGHINEDHSLLTKVQSMLLDGHFLIEQTARSHSGRFFNFNGTGGIWRRSCIEDSGGWQHDTLAEDLDLSYRAQINGWRFVYLPTVITPAELPVDMNAFKAQQHRWAKGSMQTCKKLLPLLWRSNVPLKIKFEGTVHLTSNLGYVMLLVLCIFLHGSVAAAAARASGDNSVMKVLLVDVPLFFGASVSMVSFYFCAQKELHPKWWKRLLYIPCLMAVGTGLCINNARAVLEAIFNHKSDFVRTPKYGFANRRPRKAAGYKALRGIVPFIELAFSAYFAWRIFQACDCSQWAMIPFMLIFHVGFLYVGMMSLAQTAFAWFRPEPETELSPANA